MTLSRGCGPVLWGAFLWATSSRTRGRARALGRCSATPVGRGTAENHSRCGLAGYDNAWHAPAGPAAPDREESVMRGTTASIEKWLLGYSEDVARASGNTQSGDPRPC